MSKLADIVLKVEEIISAGLLSLIAVLVFVSALARTIGHPVNWAQDMSLLAFGWLTFLGSDVIIRHGNLIRIDMLVNKLPKCIQSVLTLIFDALMLIFLAILVVYGYKLVNQSWLRSFNTLSVSYAWCTMAVPVGSFLMFFSVIGKTKRDVLNMLGKEQKKA